MAHNQLSKVPANVFSHLTQLNSLELEGNQITYVDKDAFAGLEGKDYYILFLEKKKDPDKLVFNSFDISHFTLHGFSAIQFIDLIKYVYTDWQ